MNVAIVCSTPLHILNAFNFKNNVFKDSDKIDIYICNHFHNAYEIYKRLYRENIFYNVIWIEDIDINNKNRFIRNIKINELFKNNNIKDIYDYILISNITPFTYKLINVNKKNKKDLKVGYSEDGIESYLKSIKPPIKFRIKNKLLNKKNKDSFIDELYFYKPEFVIENCNSIIYELKSMKQIFKNKTDIEVINSIFNNDIKNKIEVKNLILTQAFDNEDDEIIQMNLIKSILEENIDVKLKIHPRENTSKYEEYKNKVAMFNHSIPFELLLLNDQIKCENIISIASTANLAKTIYMKEETKAIFMFNLIDFKSKKNDKLNIFINSIKNRLPQCIYTPTSINQVKELIK